MFCKPVKTSAKAFFELEIRCSIQLSYGHRMSTDIAVFRDE